MREIKFRAWTGQNLGYSYNDNLERLFALKRIAGNLNESPVIFEQFTGLHDKNGKEIYEGDVVRDGFDSVRTIKWFDNLGYDGGGATHSGFYFDETYDGIGELNYHNHMTDCEILGNIHENPELLNAR